MSVEEESGNLGDLIETVVHRILSGVSTTFPATITKSQPSKVNPNTTVVDVISAFGLLNQITGTPEPVQLLNIPLVYPARTNSFIIRPPTDPASLVGVNVKISVCDTFLADWKKTGGVNTPVIDARKFDKGDAIAEFGLYPDSISWYTPAKPLTAQIKTRDGTFLEIGNSSTDMLRVIADMLSIVAQPDSMGGSLASVPSLISGKTLAQLSTEFATLFNPDPTP